MAKERSRAKVRSATGRPRSAELTPAQTRTFEAIREHLESEGVSPTLAELANTLGMTTGPVHQSIKFLIAKGYVEREPNVSRGLRILREPAERIRGLVSLPLLGAVSAGTPNYAEEDLLGEALVPADLVDGEECFALKVSGESMKGAGMRDGDTVVVKRTPVARNGEVVVAMVDGEATIKRFVRDGDTVELRPENRRFKPIPVTGAMDFRIVGTVVAHSQQWS